MSTAAHWTFRRRAAAALIPALLAAALVSCSSDGAPTAPPVDETTTLVFAPASDPAALSAALQDVRTRLLPALEGTAGSGVLGPAVLGLEAALADRDAVTFAWRLPEAEAALEAAADGDAASRVELAAVELVFQAARAALRTSEPSGDTP